MKRRLAVGTVVAALLLLAVLWVAHRRNSSSTGSTYDVTTQYVEGGEFCSGADEIDVYGTKWFGIVDPSDGKPAQRSYEGTLFVVDQGADIAGGRTGQARFTTGATTVSFVRSRPCV